MQTTHHPESEAFQVPTMQVSDRATFIIRTYNHLFGAILAFTGFEYLLFKTGVALPIARAMLSVNWLFILGAFMIVGWLASRFAHRSTSLGVQYLALTGFVIAQALLFVPVLFIANSYAPGAIQSAALVTIMGFAGLTAVAFWTRKDFSFLRSLLMFGGIAALVAIVAGAASSWVPGSRWGWSSSPAPQCSTIPPTSSITSRGTDTSEPRWSCSLQWP